MHDSNEHAHPCAIPPALIAYTVLIKRCAAENNIALQEKWWVPAQSTRMAQEAFDPGGAKRMMTSFDLALNLAYQLLGHLGVSTAQCRASSAQS